MGRKKAVHPADAYRRKLRQKERKKNKTVRQMCRAANMRKKSEDEIINEIQKINAAENFGLADTKLLVRRKHLLLAFGDIKVRKKIREAKEKTAKTITVKGLNKLLGIQEDDKKMKSVGSLLENAGKENINRIMHEEELEWPPGMPIDPAHQRPPGITERAQNTRRARTYLRRKEPAPQVLIPQRRSFGEVEIINSERLTKLEISGRKYKRNGVAAQLLDPLNPASPFYLDNPRHRGMIPRRDPIPVQVPVQQTGVPVQQTGAKIGPSRNPMASAIAPAAAPQPLPVYPNPHEQTHKLEVLLSDEMKAFVPTSLRVRRHAPKGKKQARKNKTLDIAPDVGKQMTKVTDTKNVGKKKATKKAGMVTEKSYDAFLAEIENLV